MSPSTQIVNKLFCKVVVQVLLVALLPLVRHYFPAFDTVLENNQEKLVHRDNFEKDIAPLIQDLPYPNVLVNFTVWNMADGGGGVPGDGGSGGSGGFEGVQGDPNDDFRSTLEDEKKLSTFRYPIGNLPRVYSTYPDFRYGLRSTWYSFSPFVDENEQYWSDFVAYQRGAKTFSALKTEVPEKLCRWVRSSSPVW